MRAPWWVVPVLLAACNGADLHGDPPGPDNHAPAAVADEFLTGEVGVAIQGNVLTNDFDDDGDALTAAVSQAPAHGTVVLHPDGAFTYTPHEGYAGLDGFWYKASDGMDESETTVDLRVNSPPVANADTYTISQGGTLVVTAPGVLANDLDLDHDGLKALLDIETFGGTVSLANNGGFTYTPRPDFTGTDQFEYHAVELAGPYAWRSEQATVTILVEPAE